MLLVVGSQRQPAPKTLSLGSGFRAVCSPALPEGGVCEVSGELGAG